MAETIRRLEDEKKRLEVRLDEFKASSALASAQVTALSGKLVEADRRLAPLATQTRDAQERLLSEEQQAKRRTTELEAEVERLHWQLDSSKVTLAARQTEAEALQERLSSVERELDLQSAKTQLGSLVAARNLHIVDVYDADPNGKRRRSFGRVFYIEGKSLVFYAYDLDAAGRFTSNVAFHVWGGKAGITDITYSLGILHREDLAGEGRWAMTFDDPKVLAQINTAFVTAEPANKQYDQPHGKRVLYAYFGNPPNHP
jgi:hypothetical protein